MDERSGVAASAAKIAAAIGRRDVETLRDLLAPGFVHRTVAGAAADAEAFLGAIAQIPGEILSVRLDELQIDLFDGWAMATGFQQADVRIDGQVVVDRRPFVDWFVKSRDEWRILAAVDIPGPDTKASQ